MNFRVLIKEDERLFIAHCLEMDIVTVSDKIDQVKEDIKSLIKAQIEYAIENNNFDYLYNPAPREIWEKYFECQLKDETSKKIKKSLNTKAYTIVPDFLVFKGPSLITASCHG